MSWAIPFSYWQDIGPAVKALDTYGPWAIVVFLGIALIYLYKGKEREHKEQIDRYERNIEKLAEALKQLGGK